MSTDTPTDTTEVTEGAAPGDGADPPNAIEPDWGPDTGATTAEYAITTLAAVMP